MNMLLLHVSSPKSKTTWSNPIFPIIHFISATGIK